MREMGTADAPATDGSDDSPARAGHWHDGPAAVTADCNDIIRHNSVNTICATYSAGVHTSIYVRIDKHVPPGD